MKELRLKLTGLNFVSNPIVRIDGESVRYKRNAFGSYEIVHRCESDLAEILIFSRPELSSRFWWLYALISYLFSFFGIFEPPYGRKQYGMILKTNVRLTGSDEFKIAFHPPADGKQAAIVNGEAEHDDAENRYFIDNSAKRRKSIVLILKIVSWIALIIAAIYFIKQGVDMG